MVVSSSTSFDELPPNGLPLSCAAPIDRDHARVHLALKNAPISRPRSGVSSSGGLGGPARRSVNSRP